MIDLIKNDYKFSNLELVDIAFSAADPTYFAETHCKISTIDDITSFKLTPIQRVLLQTWHEEDSLIATVGRQEGKTTLAVVYALWYAMFHANKVILLVGHNLNAATNMMAHLKAIHSRLPPYLQLKLTVNNKTAMQFNNGASIIASSFAGNILRGRTFNLIILDEFAFTTETIANSLQLSLGPAMSFYNIQLLITTTPSREPWFSEFWRSTLLPKIEFV